MDKCVAFLVALTISSDLVTGRTYRGISADSHEDFHHSFEHASPEHWHNGRPCWEENDHKKHEDKGKEYWRSHHPINSHSNSDSGWGYQKQPSHWYGEGVHSNWNEGPSISWNQGLPPKGQSGGNNHNIPPWYNTGSNTGSQPSSRMTTSSTTTLQPLPAMQTQLATALCLRSCPVTSEYNPVCGSNNVTYGNPGRLECARYCGISVTIRRNAPCTANQTFASQQNAPIKDIKPTRFTTIEIPTTSPATPPTIPQDVLNSIFTTQNIPTPSNTDDDNYDIDIRTRSRIQSIPLQYVYPIHRSQHNK